MSPEAIDAMLLAGCSAEQIAAAVKADMRAEADRLEEKRAKRREGNRKRQQTYRERHNANNAHNAVTSRDIPSPEVSPAPLPNPNPELPPSPPKGGSSPTVDEPRLAFEAWNELAAEHDLPQALKLDDKRRRNLKARLAEVGGLAGWSPVLAKVAASSFCAGRKTDFRADLDFILQPKSFRRLVEGSYDDHRPAPQPNGGHHDRSRPHAGRGVGALEGALANVVARNKLHGPPEPDCEGHEQAPGGFQARELSFDRGADGSYGSSEWRPPRAVGDRH